jgi:hypothetical protein
MDSMETLSLEGLVTSIRLKKEIHTDFHLLLQIFLAAATTIHFINRLRQVLVVIFSKFYSSVGHVSLLIKSSIPYFGPQLKDLIVVTVYIFAARAYE